MSMIFPGMDPYLEDPALWQGVHNSMVTYIRDHLQPQLAPRYVAMMEGRVFLEGPDRHIGPDVWLRRHWPDAPGAPVATLELDVPIEVEVPDLEVNESYINIVDLKSNRQVVTVIELLSPTNKYAGEQRNLYLTKQREVRASSAHLVEIDLLRKGPHVLAVDEGTVRAKYHYDYLISVNRARSPRYRFQIYPIALPQRLPRVRIPLADADPDVRLDLQEVLAETYRRGAYRSIIDYSKPCLPPLSPEQEAWADDLIRQARIQQNGA